MYCRHRGAVVRDNRNWQTHPSIQLGLVFDRRYGVFAVTDAYGASTWAYVRVAQSWPERLTRWLDAKVCP